MNENIELQYDEVTTVCINSIEFSETLKDEDGNDYSQIMIDYDVTTTNPELTEDTPEIQQFVSTEIEKMIEVAIARAKELESQNSE